jgi:Na+-transporting NADH:ubiquinone oxidoreductase subunit NqrB
MRTTMRLFLFIEGLSFLLASMIHRGALIAGYAHQQASIAETSIAVVLLAALGLTWLWASQTRLIATIAQALALFGTLVGIFTIAVGVGPRTGPDIAYHITILAVLTWGLVVAARAPAGSETKDAKGEVSP